MRLIAFGKRKEQRIFNNQQKLDLALVLLGAVGASIKSRCRGIYKLPESHRRASSPLSPPFPLSFTYFPILHFHNFLSSILSSPRSLGFYKSPESHWGSSPHSSTPDIFFINILPCVTWNPFQISTTAQILLLPHLQFAGFANYGIPRECFFS